MKSVREERIGILPGVDLNDKFLDRHTLTDICRTKAASRFALLISQLFLQLLITNAINKKNAKIQPDKNHFAFSSDKLNSRNSISYTFSK